MKINAISSVNIFIAIIKVTFVMCDVATCYNNKVLVFSTLSNK